VALKVALDHPSPPEAFSRAFWNPLGVTIATPSSFPSGHVARVTYLAIIAAELVRARSVRIALAVLVAYTFWARIYIGNHWVSDAIGGLALGIAAGCAAAMWIDGQRAYDRRA
jgi:membrane-associated phospholipid phosphatase